MVVACESWVMVLAWCFAVLGVQWGCCRAILVGRRWGIVNSDSSQVWISFGHAGVSDSQRMVRIGLLR